MLKVLQVIQDQVVELVLKVIKEFRVLKVLLVLVVELEELVLKDTKEDRVLKDIKEIQMHFLLELE